MKSAKKFDLMNSFSWKNEFWSHEIRPPDPESLCDLQKVLYIKLFCPNLFGNKKVISDIFAYFLRDCIIDQLNWINYF
jgi:hypothetical protein